VLHPQEDDHLTHSHAHQRRRRYLCNVLEARLAGGPTAVVLDDVRIAWDVPDLEPHGPDIAVVLGVRERKNWSTFDVADEGVLPALLIEITSPSTAVLDRSVKLEEYELAGVPLYIIVDTVGRRRQPVLRLLGYTLTPDGYQQLSANEHGWLWLEPARTWLGVQGNEIVCYDEDGQPVGDYLALAAALAQEARARQAAEEARQVAEQRATEAERLARMERQAREALEARLRALEAGGSQPPGQEAS
jgi:Uma2 family endonuclease